MTLHILREIVDQMDDDENEPRGGSYPVYVALAPDGMMGGTATTPVETVGFGFDWDHGKVIIWTRDKIRK